MSELVRNLGSACSQTYGSLRDAIRGLPHNTVQGVTNMMMQYDGYVVFAASQDSEDTVLVAPVRTTDATEVRKARGAMKPSGLRTLRLLSALNKPFAYASSI